jgi:hypothetical protein
MAREMCCQYHNNITLVADKEHPESCFFLAKIHEKGSPDFRQDLPYALRLYEEAAELGYIPAIIHLGELYERGGGLITNPKPSHSVWYYSIGLQLGDPACIVGMATWYSSGVSLPNNPNFLPKDETKAFQIVYKVSKKDFPRADYTLGHFYETGIGCYKNLELAKESYKYAASIGYDKAKKRLEELKPLNKRKNIGFISWLFTNKK